MNTKHTPGPWEIVEDTYSPLISSEDNLIAKVFNNCEAGNDCPESENKANANLISAAPEMLEALELVIKAGEAIQQGKRDGVTMGNMSAAIDTAMAVVAKAKGE